MVASARIAQPWPRRMQRLDLGRTPRKQERRRDHGRRARQGRYPRLRRHDVASVKSAMPPRWKDSAASTAACHAALAAAGFTPSSTAPKSNGAACRTNLDGVFHVFRCGTPHDRAPNAGENSPTVANLPASPRCSARPQRTLRRDQAAINAVPALAVELARHGVTSNASAAGSKRHDARVLATTNSSLR